jgi:hypothetical protein
MRDLKSNLGISQKRLAELFSDNFIPRLMMETFKQLKKSEDSAGDSGANFSSSKKKIESQNRAMGQKKDGKDADQDDFEE